MAVWVMRDISGRLRAALQIRYVLVPAVEKALKQHRNVRVYYQVDADFTGIDSGAAWEDFKVGMEHLRRWERVAVVTNVDWIRHTIKIFSFLMPGEAKLFPTSEKSAARDWIIAA